MSDDVETAPDTDRKPDAGNPPPELLAPAIGILVVIIAASSLLDDTGLIEHPWWASFAIGAAAAAMALAGRTITKLVQADQ